MWHWYEALKELGADVHIPWITKEFQKRVENPDYDMNAKYDVIISENPSDIDWRETDTFKILYLTDVPRFIPNKEISMANIVCSASKLVKPKKILFIPFACPTKWFYEQKQAVRGEALGRWKDTCFIGNDYRGRYDWLRELGVDCFTANWEESRDIYSSYKIRVGSPIIFADTDEQLSDMHTTNVYEAMGCGILTITHNKIPSIKHLVTYNTKEECKELIDYYLKNDKERERVAKLQYEEVIKNHTYLNRMEVLLNEI